MKTLIINGSPRKNGNTAFLINELKKHLKGEIIELSAYRANIKPCDDCRYCHKQTKCSKKDDMQIIYNDDFENVIIATPLYLSTFPGPLKNIADRMQVYSSSKRFLKVDMNLKQKKGALILVGGGCGHHNKAIDLATYMFKKLNTEFHKDKDIVSSLKTDTISADKDNEALEKVKEIAISLNK